MTAKHERRNVLIKVRYSISQNEWDSAKQGVYGMEQLLWIADHVVAHVDHGAVTIQIDRPVRYLSRKVAFEVADKTWYAGQMRELEVAKQRGESKEIPLTSRRRRSSLRLGGGFMITQGTKLVLLRRTLDAPRPGQFCECGGVFEVYQESEAYITDPWDVRNDFVASLLRESQEVVLVRGDTLYVPQLPPSISERPGAMPSVPIGFQPPGTLDAYNSIIGEEMEKEIKAAQIFREKPKQKKHFWMKILDYDQATKLQFAYSPEVSVEITAEPDTSSLEVVGVLYWPEDIDSAAAAFEGEENASAPQRQSRKKPKPFEYYDAELTKEGFPANREVHVIDTETGADTVWYGARTEAGRKCRENTTIWNELSTTRLGKTAGRVATEKVEKAIKMHCPYPHLQPLVRL